ncbi:PadR family transcriptional regulator [Fusibacter bizertensis]|uniref:PadR family transcriptional regulator n=1 Tax=Fusibacter bizertensis TaxID=1488331 RepID=A0ABT6NE89_9FIRM|nr:PadR family transcriptional regulator [Fusibacter bizertensis]MDH8678736.1 PadR family transcriptional regulator [Fusibacter bizertensis]
MSLKHGILGLLNYGPTTGYELDKSFKGTLNFFWQAQTSQIYRELSTMEKQGWVTSEMIIQSDKPNKKLFSLTESGKEELNRWLMHDSIKEDIRVKDPFLVKLFFSGEVDASTNIETMKQFVKCCHYAFEKIKESIKQCEEASEADKKAIYWGMTASFGYYYYEMCIRWAEDTILKMEELL